MDVVFAKTLTIEKFIQDIENLVSKHGLDYMDAIVHYCSENNVEIETAASIIKVNAKMKAKLQSEGEALNFLPKRARLPL